MSLRVFSFLFAAIVLSTGTICHAQADAPAEVGTKAPDFAATGIDGKSFKLSDRTGKGKAIILMFSRANW